MARKERALCNGTCRRLLVQGGHWARSPEADIAGRDPLGRDGWVSDRQVLGRMLHERMHDRVGWASAHHDAIQNQCRTIAATVLPEVRIFFTVNLLDRHSDLLAARIDALRDSVRETRLIRPFHIDAWVVLPDHLHCLWTLSPGDADFPRRWQMIKARFSGRVAHAQNRRARWCVAQGVYPRDWAVEDVGLADVGERA